MKLSIHREIDCGQEELRAMLLDAAEQLAGKDSRILESKLPWDGHPILLADAELHPVVVSFDAEQSQAALLNGLLAVEKLSSALAWVNQVYEPLQQQQRPPRLVVVSTDYPPGSAAVLTECARLNLFQYKTLRINGEMGLWLEPLQNQVREKRPPADLRALASTPPRQAPDTQATPSQRAAEDKLPTLSKEESAFFQQL